MHCCWFDRDFAAHCRQAAALGFSYVEVFFKHIQKEGISAREARRVLDDHGLVLLLMVAEPLEDSPASDERLRAGLVYFAEVGVSLANLRAAQGTSTDEFRRAVARAVLEAESLALTPVVQNLRGSLIQTPDDLLSYADTGARLHYDTQQFYMAGVPALDAWDRLAGTIVHAHVADRSDPETGCAFGEGAIGLEELLTRMHGDGYRGAFTFEVESTGLDDNVELVERSKEFVERILEPLGALSQPPVIGE